MEEYMTPRDLFAIWKRLGRHGGCVALVNDSIGSLSQQFLRFI